jgi:UDP-N-acetylmuramoylalanine--D-glutamate ligase
MDFTGKKIVIIGMGKTGIAVARFLGKQGAKVAVTDEKPVDQWGVSLNKLPKKNGWKSATIMPVF